MGVRPLYFCHLPGKLFAFASEVRALLSLQDVPKRQNEGRVADALVGELEGIDRTSTFYLDIHRLPPARVLTLSSGKVEQSEYWSPVLRRPQGLPATDAEWIEAVRARLATAVADRLRGVGRQGALVSGGLDSSSVAALAQHARIEVGSSALRTYSVINSAERCAETTAIQLMNAHCRFDARTIDLNNVAPVAEAVLAQMANMREPFDDMALISAIYAMAASEGTRVLLDGVPADNLYTAVGLFRNMMRRGRIGDTWREALALYVRESHPTPRLRAARSVIAAAAPRWVITLLERWRDEHFYRQLVRTAEVPAELAARVALRQRFARYRADIADSRMRDPAGQAHSIMTAAYITAGIERYNRVASFHGIEPRHPFLDRELIELHAWMPLDLRLRDGFHKWALRKAMAQWLPAEVAWRCGKEHLGQAFRESVMRFEQAMAGRILGAASS